MCQKPAGRVCKLMVNVIHCTLVKMELPIGNRSVMWGAKRPRRCKTACAELAVLLVETLDPLDLLRGCLHQFMCVVSLVDGRWGGCAGVGIIGCGSRCLAHFTFRAAGEASHHFAHHRSTLMASHLDHMTLTLHVPSTSTLTATSPMFL